jgi:polysaccharide biosynthesis/export protein
MKYSTRPNPRPLLGVILAAFSASMLGGCAAPALDVGSMVRDWANFMQADYVLRPNDQITINVQPDGPTQTLVVPPTGRLNLAGIEQPIEAVGKPVRVFRATVQEAYRKVFRDDIIVQVSLLQTAVSSLFVTGEVNQPGPINYTPGMSLTQAISSAGGWIYRAKLTDVRVIRPSPSGKPKTYRVNLDMVYHDSDESVDFQDFLVLPGDVVYCQSVWIADVADTIDLYLWSLLPFRSPGITAAGL